MWKKDVNYVIKNLFWEFVLNVLLDRIILYVRIVISEIQKYLKTIRVINRIIILKCLLFLRIKILMWNVFGVEQIVKNVNITNVRFVTRFIFVKNVLLKENYLKMKKGQRHIRTTTLLKN